MTDLHVYRSDRAGVVARPLPAATHGASVCRLRCLTGASAVHLVLAEASSVRLRAEVRADGGEIVEVRSTRREDGLWVVTSPGRQVLSLPADERHAPPLPLPPARSGQALDVALLVDGTMRRPEGGALWADDDTRAAWTARLGAWVEALTAASPGSRVAVVAFGDEPPPRVKAADLQPSYLLAPAEKDRRFAPPEAVGRLLAALSPSSGGDFVDALGEGLAACRALPWRLEARKLLLVVGDSPGHSIREPAPPVADAAVRVVDVDREADLLHAEAGVEIATLFLEPASERVDALAYRRLLVDFARDQYRRLASRPETAFLASSFDPGNAARAVLERPWALGHGPSWGEWVEVDDDSNLELEC